MMLKSYDHARCSYIANLWATGKDHMACAWISYNHAGRSKSYISGRYGYT
jgi:hypothetical protein